MQTVPYIPENAPFNQKQRSWLNGYLAGLFAVTEQTGAPSAPCSPENDTVPLVILFGSQTGTAEGLARRIAKAAGAKRCRAQVVDAAAHATIDWQAARNLLVVTSTYGDGDMPDNAQSFWDWLQSDGAKCVGHLNFSVLALGDTTYTEFCAAGKKIDARLEQLGAKRFHPRADCNLDYEPTAAAWMEQALEKLLALPVPSSSFSPSSSIFSPKPNELESAVVAALLPPTREHPFPARLLVNRLLNPGSEKETRHFEISLENSGINYEAGDALGVVPSNCPALVEDLLRALGRDGEEAVPAPDKTETSLRKALTTAYDITRPGTELLHHAAKANGNLRALLAPEQRDALKTWLHGREVIDVLLETPGLRFTPAEFVALLKKLAPRLYSISSSPKAHNGQVHLTINLVRHQSHGRSRKGVCSTFLADRIGEQTSVPIFPQPSRNFRLPPSNDAPIIMVGPGTGIAPFRAFLHERRALGAKGRNWLFFGEQRAATDFYYSDELQSMLADGHLTKLSTAFSRDQTDKIYVQHRMAEHAAELWAWLQEGAHFYVCGDASRMAKDVDAALHEIARKAGGLSNEAANTFVKTLKDEKRYQRDVY